ncbi:cytosine deaminase-like metal-dependent hydrolase [Thiovulum sp. ES]|nr:cytosine deaminase-like metal-dependent hydrolase [Thiovulum sp. ES]
MRIVSPKYIFSNGEILENLSVAFSEKIEKIGTLQDLKNEFPNAEISEIRENSLMMAGFVNSHVHLEYSHHTTEYNYGDFISWLNSVVANFPNLSQNISDEVMNETLNRILKSGTTTVGVISSLGLDLEVLKNSPIRKVVFNEIIASQPHQVDSFYQLWLSRLQKSEELQDEKFTPAVSLHSPYSVHRIVAKKVVELAKTKNYKISAHSLESKAERDWLDSESGEFYDFYMRAYGNAHRHTTVDEFFETLDLETILVHGNYLNDSELEKISGNHLIAHSPISNRLLGNKKLDLQKMEKFGIPWILATDGLSSNYSLDMLEEMKIALFLHENMDLESFGKDLLLASTSRPAKALGLNVGDISENILSDFIFIDLGNLEFDNLQKIPLHTILKGEVYKTFVAGKEI